MSFPLNFKGRCVNFPSAKLVENAVAKQGFRVFFPLKFKGRCGNFPFTNWKSLCWRGHMPNIGFANPGGPGEPRDNIF